MAARFIGKALQGVRAGESRMCWNHPGLHSPATITLASPAFGPGEPMPARYASQRGRADISPPLTWHGVPESAVELVLIVEDVDAPGWRPLVHCIASGMAAAPATSAGGLPAGSGGLAEGALSTVTPASQIRVARRYRGPRPIAGHGPHRYVFQIFALDQPFDPPGKITAANLAAAVSGHVIARGRLEGRYEAP